MNRVLLCIIDGFGFRRSRHGNPTYKSTFFFDLLKRYPWSLLRACGKYVGLPKDHVGGSEVGHMAIGCGRIVKQILSIIDEAIASGTIEKEDSLLDFIRQAKSKKGAVHVIGLFSNGGIHSKISHFIWAINFLKRMGIPTKAHLFLDGIDSPMKDAAANIKIALDNGSIQKEDIVSLCGRRIAMNCNGNFDMTSKVIDLILHGKAKNYSTNPIATLKEFYKNSIYDDEIPPINVNDYSGASPNDSFFIINFRSDRIAQLVSLLVARKMKVLCMTNCIKEFESQIDVIFERQDQKNSLGEILSQRGIKQLRIAESEKFAHITRFFNGGVEQAFPLEDRILISTKDGAAGPKFFPAMSSEEITTAVIEGIKKDYGFVCVNFACTDVVGHLGCLDLAEKAVLAIDKCLMKLYDACIKYNCDMIVTADHGNIDTMIDDNGYPHKLHSFARVPFILISKNEGKQLRKGVHNLSDIAPTVLKLLEIKDWPKEITGKSIIEDSEININSSF